VALPSPKGTAKLLRHETHTKAQGNWRQEYGGNGRSSEMENVLVALKVASRQQAL